MAAADDDVNLADALLWHRYRVKFLFWARSTLQLSLEDIAVALNEFKNK